MRSDMKKVLTERPRGGTRFSQVVRERFFDSRDPEDDGPLRESMSWHRHGRSKHFSDHLNPLLRFLRSNVGRPWDKVWSEICEHNRLDSVQGRHVREHVEGYVQQNIVMRDKKPFYLPKYVGRYQDGDGYTELSPGNLYVNPDTGLLCKYGNGPDYGWKYHGPSKPANPDLLVIAGRNYGRFDGVWYEITLCQNYLGWVVRGSLRYPWVEQISTNPYDSLLKRTITPDEAISFYGKAAFCSAKRQLNKKEKKKLGIK